MRKILIFLCLLFLMLNANSQQVFHYGKILDDITKLPVMDAQVENLSNRQTDISNSKGLFVIKAIPSDSIQVVRVGYYNKTFSISELITKADTMILYLVPKTKELESVTISAYGYNDYQRDSADRRLDFEQSVGYSHHLFDNANGGAGLGISLDRIFGSKQRNKRKAYKLLMQTEEQKYIDFRYNPIIVHTYTGLTGDSLQTFINKTTPSNAWLRENTSNEAIMYYINEKLKSYFHRAN